MELQELIHMNGNDRDDLDEWLRQKEKIDAEIAKTGPKRLNVNLPISMHRRLKVAAAKDNETMSDVVMKLIWRYLRTP